MVRETWTDERLDDLNKKVDDGFARVDARFESLESRIDARFDGLEARIDARFQGIDSRFQGIDARFQSLEERIDAKFDGLNRTLIGSAAVIVAAIIGSSAI